MGTVLRDGDITDRHVLHGGSVFDGDVMSDGGLNNGDVTVVGDCVFNGAVNMLCLMGI